MFSDLHFAFLWSSETFKYLAWTESCVPQECSPIKDSLDPIRCRVKLGQDFSDPDDIDTIYGIQMRYGEVWGDLHGTGEKEFESLLPEGEQLWAVVGKPVHISKSQIA